MTAGFRVIQSPAATVFTYRGTISELASSWDESNQITFISECKNSAHSKHVMHLGGTARRIALTAAQCYSFIYKYKKTNY